MKSTILWALVLLNAALLISFFARLTPSDSAIAQQIATGNRRPGEYAMITGNVTGSSSGVVYLIDTSNALLTAITYDQSGGNQGRLVSMPKIDLAAVFARGAAESSNPPINKSGARTR